MFNKCIFSQIKVLFLSIVLSVSCFTMVYAGQGDSEQDFNRITGQIETADKNVYQASDGNLYYFTTDTKATTSITYKTTHLVISEDGNPTNGYVVNIDDVPAERRVQVAVERPDGSTLLTEGILIGNVANIGNRLGTTNIRMDCGMVTCRDGIEEGIYYTAPESMALLAAELGKPISEIKSDIDLMNAYGWKDKSGIASHFVWKLKLLDAGFTLEEIEKLNSKLKEEGLLDDDKIDDENIDDVVAELLGTNVDKTKSVFETGEAEYKTGNEAGSNKEKYCIFEGIPSGKKLNNYWSADNWMAGTQAYAFNKFQEFNHKVVFTWQKWESHGTHPGPDGEDVPDKPILVTYSQTAYYPGAVGSSYTYLEQAASYASFKGTVENKAFDGPKSYDGPSLTGEYKPSSTKLTFKTPGGLHYQIDLGIDGDAKLAEAMLQEGIYTYQCYREDGVDSENDKWVLTCGEESHTIIEDGVCHKGIICGVEDWAPDWTEMPPKLQHEMFPESASVVHHYGLSGTLSSIDPINTEDSKKDFPIPVKTDNGRYGTKVSIEYQDAGIGNGGNYEHSFSTDAPYSAHVIDKYFPDTQHGGCGRDRAYDSYYPIEVHTPIHAPVQIINGTGETLDGNKRTNYEGASGNTAISSGVLGNKGNSQLVKESNGVDYELSLDHWYAIRWDWYNHRQIMGYGESGNKWSGAASDLSRDKASKYDEFVLKKTMQFPFEVMYNGKFYAANEVIEVSKPSSISNNANYGYNKKIREYESNNHWVVAPIYIPSYARETVGNITYKVYAVNVDARYTGNHSSDEEREGNFTYKYEELGDVTGEGAKYVATYSIPVETSGIIYDFTIVGTTDSGVHEQSRERQSNIDTDFSVALASIKEEKKVGTKNRVGGDVLRYLLDGEAVSPWSERNTLVLTDGKSNIWKGMGSVVKGTKFSFTVKTIANLWGKDDYIAIVPTFRYISPSGKEVEDKDLAIYYNSATTDDIFVKRGGGRDTNAENTQFVKIGDPQFKGSYYGQDMSQAQGQHVSVVYHYGDWADYTAKKENEWNGTSLSRDEILGRKTPSYNMSAIKLSSTQRLLSGECEQLEWNLNYDAYNRKDEYGQTLKKYSDLKMAGVANIPKSGKEGREIEDLFRYSMQTWYGQFYLPADLYVVDKTKNPGFTELTDYIAKNGGEIEYTDPIFERGGSLVVNFKIITYKTPKNFDNGKQTSTNAEPHLKYYGGNNGGNMWKREGFDYTPDPDINPDVPVPQKYRDGDVVLVDLSQSIRDRYESGLFNIN